MTKLTIITAITGERFTQFTQLILWMERLKLSVAKSYTDQKIRSELTVLLEYMISQLEQASEVK